VISRALGEDIFGGPPQRGASVPVEKALLTWFRGHDIAHTAALPTTDYSWDPVFGHEPFMAMQEVLADVYGLLLALTPSWLALSGLSPVDLCDTFMAELLHYLRRGGWLYGDAGAAYVELSYLAMNGHVEVTEDGHMSWDTERLHEGMRGLAKLLAETVLAPTDAGPCQGLWGRYGWPAETPAARVFERMSRRLSGIPTALAYGNYPNAISPEG
jgi:hypothetical protein